MADDTQDQVVETEVPLSPQAHQKCVNRLVKWSGSRDDLKIPRSLADIRGGEGFALGFSCGLLANTILTLFSVQLLSVVVAIAELFVIFKFFRERRTAIAAGILTQLVLIVVFIVVVDFVADHIELQH